MTCNYFHGTSTMVLPLIADEGLLPCNVLQKKGRRVCFHESSKDDVVYLIADSPSLAHMWAGYAAAMFFGERIVLCVQTTTPLRRDRNLLHVSNQAFEHPGPIPPEQLAIHDEKAGCHPIREWVKLALEDWKRECTDW